MSPLLTSQVAYILFILCLFLFYGSLVRRGFIAGRAIIGVGVIVGIVAATVSFFHIPLETRRQSPLLFLVLPPAMMALCAAVCVWLAYRAQTVLELATFSVGDTRVGVRYAPAARIEADALLLTTTTVGRMLSSVSAAVGIAAGSQVEKAVVSQAPLGIGKVVATGGGRLAVDQVFHAAVHEPQRPVTEAALRRGMENAAQQARKAGAETIAVPVGSVRGIPLPRAAEIVAEAVLKQRRAFLDITFVALDMRSAPVIREAVERAVNALTPAVR